MSLSGNLKTVSFPDILQLLATGKKSGILDVKTGARQKEVAFRNGNIIHATSVNSSEDLLGNMLVNRGKISKSDLDRAIKLHHQTGRQLGTTLIDMNIFDKKEIAEVLKQQIEEIVYNLFSWTEGDFIFREGEAPKEAPFLVDLATMNIIMEGTRRIDEWLEIRKVLPSDDVLLAISKVPSNSQEYIKLTPEEFSMLGFINGDHTLAELINLSPMGEFVTCRGIYKLIVNNLIEAIGKRDQEEEEKEDEEEAVLEIIYKLYDNCIYRIRCLFEEMLGENNQKYKNFSTQYKSGLLGYFPGTDPTSTHRPSFENFLQEVRSIPPQIRFHKLIRDLDHMLCDHLQFTFDLLGYGSYRDSISAVKREISEPLARRRDLVKQFGLEDNLYRTINRADKTVKMVRG